MVDISNLQIIFIDICKDSRGLDVCQNYRNCIVVNGTATCQGKGNLLSKMLSYSV